jgi:hypothetical protein
MPRRGSGRPSGRVPRRGLPGSRYALDPAAGVPEQEPDIEVPVVPPPADGVSDDHKELALDYWRRCAQAGKRITWQDALAAVANVST